MHPPVRKGTVEIRPLHPLEGLPPARGQTYVLPGGAFFTLRGGMVARVSNYYNLEDWLRQVRG